MITVPTVRHYQQCATRLENRGAYPPTPAYVDALVEALETSGVEASWHAAVDHSSMPLFPSHVFPVSHPQASLEAFRYLIDRLHGIGRPVLSWYALNLGGGVLPAHPEWRMHFYAMDGIPPNPEAETHYVCLNSPYGELLPAFAAEVVRDVGFDGLWIDGSTCATHHTWPPFQPGCRCEFCRTRFQEDTGLALPEAIDLGDRTVRRWVRWRYDVLMDLWRRLVDAVHAANPEAVVCFNNYRRRPYGTWSTAIPLRPLGWDALMSSELDNCPGQADLQMKLNRAYRLQRGVESWWPLCDHWNMWVPDVEPLTAVQAALGCVSAGGVASTGTGVPPTLVTGVLRAMEEAVVPRMPYVEGETVEYAAIVASQATMDFYATPEETWDGIHGANEFCRHAHLQSSILFDDDLAEHDLSHYPVILLGNTACLSAAAATKLGDYVRAGGVLVATHEVGLWNELGEKHALPALDWLFGIRDRKPGKGTATLEISAQWVKESGPYVTVRGPHTLALPIDSVRLVGTTVDRTTNSWDGLEETPEGKPAPRSAGLWVRQLGSGYAVYAGGDLFPSYLRYPTAHLMRLLRAVVTTLAAPRVTARAPMCVTVNTRVLPDGRWAVHLHNAPGSAYAYPNPPNSTALHAPGEIYPLENLFIELTGVQAKSARSGLTGAPYRVTVGRFIRVLKLQQHEVIVLEMEA